jgi:hypothetical protein
MTSRIQRARLLTANEERGKKALSFLAAFFQLLTPLTAHS